MRLALGILLVLLTLALALCLWPGELSGVAAEPSRGQQTEPETGARSGAATEEAPAPGTQRESVRGPDSGGPATIWLVGRCVESLQGRHRPIAGVELTLRMKLDDQEFLSEQDQRTARRIVATTPSAVSDAAGRFRLPIRDRLEKPLGFRIAAAAPYAFEDGELALMRSDAEEDDQGRLILDVDDLLILPGFLVAGTVVDQRGRPLQDGLLEIGVVAQIVEGRFDCGQILAGEYEPALHADLTILSPRLLHVGPKHDTTNVRIVVQRGHVLRGRILHEDSREPIPAYDFEGQFRDHSYFSGRTDAAGRFVLYAPAPDQEHARFDPTFFQASEDKPRLLVDDVDPRWHRLPAEDVVLLARPFPRFLLRARLPDGSAPTELTVQRLGATGLRQEGKLDDDITRWVGLHPGTRSTIRVVTSGRPVARSAWFEIDPVDWRTRPREVALEPTVELLVEIEKEKELTAKASATLRGSVGPVAHGREQQAGRVVLAAPRRVAGLRLHLRARRASTSIVLTPEHERTRRVHAVLEEKPASKRAVLRVFLTDDAFPPTAWSHLIHARSDVNSKRYVIRRGGCAIPVGRCHVILTRTGAVLGSTTLTGENDRPLRIQIPDLRGGKVRGVAFEAGEPVIQSGLRFHSVDRRFRVPSFLDGKGRFEVRLPSGEYRVERTQFPVAGITLSRNRWFDGVLKVRDGATLDVELRARQTLTLRIEGPDGARLRDAWLYVARYGKVRTDATGSVTLRGPPPGRIEVGYTSRPSGAQHQGHLEATERAGKGPHRLRLQRERQP